MGGRFKFGLLLLFVVLVAFSVCLRGAVPEKTFVYREVPASAVRASIVYFDPWSCFGWSISDFSSDIGEWWRYEQNITSELAVVNGVLNLTGVFDYSRGHQFVILFRRLNIEVSKTPIFVINVSVSKGSVYHVRFVGEDANGVEREVWWETSPLDDIPGKSAWETRVVDLAVFSEQAVGEKISVVKMITFILDTSFSYDGEGEKYLSISFIGFAESNFRVSRIPGEAKFVSNERPFQAVIIDLPYYLFPDASQMVNWCSVKYRVTAVSKFDYVMVLLSKDGNLVQKAEGAVFVSHGDDLVDIYRLDAHSDVLPRYASVTFLSKWLGPLSIVILKTDFSSGGFQSFQLESVEFMFANKNVGGVDFEIVDSLVFWLVFVLVLVPVFLLVVAFKFAKKFSFNFMFALLVYGLVCRFVLAPFTGHPYDMGVWTQGVRLFYESGVLNLKIFSLPFTCYVLLLFYSPYALLRVLGFHDVGFLAHSFGMVEALFIKLPFILSDLVSFYFLLRISRRISGGKSGFYDCLPSCVFFLSPLAMMLSGVWGIYDGIAVAFFLGGIYFSVFERRHLLGVVFYAFSGVTKLFGFIGLLPLGVTLLKEKRFSDLLIAFGVVVGVVVFAYLPVLFDVGLVGVPEVFVQFLRGRIGFGSALAYVHGSSYLNVLSLLGFDVASPFLAYVLFGLVFLFSLVYVWRLRCCGGEFDVGWVLAYFISVFSVFYLTYFRVYEQYYLWILPILLVYGYVRRQSVFVLFSMLLSVFVLPFASFGVFLSGAEYYWFNVRLPVDVAVVAVLPSVVVVFVLVCLFVSLLGYNLGWRWLMLFFGVASWFALGFAYNACYGVFPFGVSWFGFSLIIVCCVVVLCLRKLGVLRW